MKRLLLPLGAAAGLMLWPQPVVRAQSSSLEKNNLKIDICHLPPGNPANGHVINVSISAAPAHYAHGDPLTWTRNGDGSCSAGDGDSDTNT